MKILRARLYDLERKRIEQERKQARNEQVRLFLLNVTKNKIIKENPKNHKTKTKTKTKYKNLQTPLNPKPFLHNLTGKHVICRLKWGMEYKGILASTDAYMNARLTNAEEYIDGVSQGQLGDILIRYSKKYFWALRCVMQKVLIKLND